MDWKYCSAIAYIIILLCYKLTLHTYWYDTQTLSEGAWNDNYIHLPKSIHYKAMENHSITAGHKHNRQFRGDYSANRLTVDYWSLHTCTQIRGWNLRPPLRKCEIAVLLTHPPYLQQQAHSTLNQAINVFFFFYFRGTVTILNLYY